MCEQRRVVHQRAHKRRAVVEAAQLDIAVVAVRVDLFSLEHRAEHAHTLRAQHVEGRCVREPRAQGRVDSRYIGGGHELKVGQQRHALWIAKRQMHSGVELGLSNMRRQINHWALREEARRQREGALVRRAVEGLAAQLLHDRQLRVLHASLAVHSGTALA